MALDNFELGIRSVTYVTGADGKPVEMDSVDWTIQDYHHNLQNEESEPLVEPLGELGKPKRKRKPKVKGLAHETPAAVGDELITKATEKDLRKRGLK